MERAIVGAPAFRRLLRFVPLLVLLSVCQTAVYAQLSDEAVLEYALEGRRNGKSEHQIGRELLARGVTAEQAERLKRKYEESQGSEVRVADRGISGQQRERVQSSSERLTAGSLDVVSSAATDPAADRSDPREVFGRDVFRSRTLTFEPNENQATPSNNRLGPGDEVIIDHAPPSEEAGSAILDGYRFTLIRRAAPQAPAPEQPLSAAESGPSEAASSQPAGENP